MAYLDTWAFSSDEQTIRRIALATAKTCWYITAEAENAPDHALRLALVNYAGPRLSDYRAFAAEIAPYLVTQNPSLSAASTDGDFDTALAGVWNTYAAHLQAKGLIQAGA